MYYELGEGRVEQLLRLVDELPAKFTKGVRERTHYNTREIEHG